MSHNDSELPTNPGTPDAKGLNKLRVMVPMNAQLTSGELRDFVTVFTTLGEDIKILEQRADERDTLTKAQGKQIAELQSAIGRIESMCSGMRSDNTAFIEEIRREIRKLK